MRTIAIITIVVLAAAFVAPLIVSAGARLTKQAKQLWTKAHDHDHN